MRIAIDVEIIAENTLNRIKARELNPDGEFIFERNGERITARAVDEKTTLSYIYNLLR